MTILLNGSINAGKSTVSKLLAREIPNSALVEVDSLSAQCGSQGSCVGIG